MSFQDAVRAVLTNYVGFTGRARRSEFWFFALFYVVVLVIANVLDAILSINLFVIIAYLALLLPYLAVGFRRLHDTDRSAWWLLIGLIPLVGGIVLLVFFVLEGTPGPNKYGNSPKGAPAAYS